MALSINPYNRLAALPSDPSNPESVAEVLVVAFDAFERYYICLRNCAGGYRQGAARSHVLFASPSELSLTFRVTRELWSAIPLTAMAISRELFDASLPYLASHPRPRR